MKKLTPEEFDQLPRKGLGRSSKFYKDIIGLKPGEALFISRQEYTLYHGPGRICKLILKRFPNVQYTYGPVADGSGWAIKRDK